MQLLDDRCEAAACHVEVYKALLKLWRFLGLVSFVDSIVPDFPLDHGPKLAQVECVVYDAGEFRHREGEEVEEMVEEDGPGPDKSHASTLVTGSR